MLTKKAFSDSLIKFRKYYRLQKHTNRQMKTRACLFGNPGVALATSEKRLRNPTKGGKVQFRLSHDIYEKIKKIKRVTVDLFLAFDAERRRERETSRFGSKIHLNGRALFWLSGRSIFDFGPYAAAA